MRLARFKLKRNAINAILFSANLSRINSLFPTSSLRLIKFKAEPIACSSDFDNSMDCTRSQMQRKRIKNAPSPALASLIINGARQRGSAVILLETGSERRTFWRRAIPI